MKGAVLPVVAVLGTTAIVATIIVAANKKKTAVLQAPPPVVPVAPTVIRTALPVAPKVVASPTYSASKPTIREGDGGAAVSQWQAFLGLPQTGLFQASTTAATKAWQAAHGITPDGIVGPATWQMAADVTIAKAASPVVSTPGAHASDEDLS